MTTEKKDSLPAPIEQEYLERMTKVDPTLFFPETWDEQDKRRGLEALGGGSRLKRGSINAIPKKCDPETCPSAEHYCPVLKAGLDPSGYKCPVEIALVENYFWGLVEELGVDVSNIVEVGLVRDLVDCYIQQIRKSEVLAQDSFIKENCVGIDASGRPVFREELHVAVEYEDKIHRRMKDIRNALLATREARAKYDVGESPEKLSASEMTKLLKLVANSKFMKEEREQLEQKHVEEVKSFYNEEDVIDADFEELEDD